MDEGRGTRLPEQDSGWLEALIAVALEQRRPCSELDVGELVEGLASRLGWRTERVSALLSGCNAVAEYAMDALDEEGDSLTEEMAALMASRRAFRPLLEARLQERVDRIEGGDEPVPRCRAPECDEAMHSKGRRKRGWLSSFVPIKLRRRWSVCSHPSHGPGRSRAEERLLLSGGSCTAKLSESLTALATTVPHGMACQLAERLLGVEVSEHALQDEVEKRAATLVAADEALAQTLNPFDERGLEREVRGPEPEVSESPAVAYVEVDGVLPMTREEDPERSQPVEGARGGKGLLILDLYHALHRLHEVAVALFGDGPAGREWRQRQKEDLEEGRVQHVIDRLRFVKPACPEPAKKVAELITYFENNADRMDYPSYRARGLRVSTASVESANYHVTGARTKAQGMRWSEKGVGEMARLRADLFNDVWEERTRQALAA